MTLKDRIGAETKDAMRARDAARLSTLRLLLAAIKQREVDERKALSDAEVVAVIDKMVRQRRESIAQFDAGHGHGGYSPCQVREGASGSAGRTASTSPAFRDIVTFSRWPGARTAGR